MQADYVIVGAGSAGLRSGQSADRGPVGAGHPDRGRRERLEPADPYPGRLHENARPQDPDLGVQGRGRRRARDHLSARPGARRLVVDQRPDLYPRPTRGLRPLGAARQSRLVVGRLPALFQTGRALGRRTRRRARQGRVSVHVEDGPVAALREGHRGRHAARSRISRGRQQSAARRRREHRLVPADPRRAPSRQHRALLSAPGAEAAEPASRDQGAGASRAVPGQARDRHRVLAQWRHRAG